MVRREEQPWQSRATALPRQPAARPPRPGRRLLARGGGLGRGLDRGPPQPPRVHGPPRHRHRRGPGHRLALPRRRPQHRSPARGARGRPAVHQPQLDTGWLAEAGHGGLMVAVFGGIAPMDVPVLRRMRLHATSAMAIALDVEPWAASSGGSGRGDATSSPSRAGAPCRCVPATGSTASGRSSATRRPRGAGQGRRPARWSRRRSGEPRPRRPRRRRRPLGGRRRDHLGRDALLARVQPVPGEYLGPLFVLGFVVAGTGRSRAGARWPVVAVVGFQVAGLGEWCSARSLSGSPVPVGRRLGPGWSRRSRPRPASAERYAAPVPAHVPGVHPWSSPGAACLLLVDLLACTLRRAPLAGLPLLTIYSVPVGMVGGGVTWWIFALTAAGFLGMLFLQESEQVARWGRPLGVDQAVADPTGFGCAPAPCAHGRDHRHHRHRPRGGGAAARAHARACSCSTSGPGAAATPTSSSRTR